MMMITIDVRLTELRDAYKTLEMIGMWVNKLSAGGRIPNVSDTVRFGAPQKAKNNKEQSTHLCAWFILSRYVATLLACGEQIPDSSTMIPHLSMGFLYISQISFLCYEKEMPRVNQLKFREISFWLMASEGSIYRCSHFSF